jgi:hypothetical protein
MNWIWMIMTMSAEALAAGLLAEARRVRKVDPVLCMGLRRQAFRLLGLGR